TLKTAGWTEQPSVINQPNMAVLQFSRNGKSVSMTVMQMGPKVNVSASGAALRMATAAPAAKAEEQARLAEPLKPDPEAQLP
ncbi:hypothetical protein, partial [Enterobacter sp. UNJFSC 003]|uniref:hypothetical protein n=1 Tax=Enterobacter sp. UNJFSC 003 TaxID=3122077 RepID=UPI002EA95184|nr:hypothetical protein [Serratia liquefaciens]